jgi:hypothetical protein
MDFSPIIQRLNELTTFMNNVRTLSKKIFELPSSTAGNKLVAVYNETSLQTEKFNLTEALDGMYSLTNGITAIGNITRDGADFTFEVGFEWKINGIEYSNAEITRTINDAGTGNHRIDIAVCDTNNDIYIIEGFEVPLATAVVQPPTPPNTLFICYFLITESVIGDNSTPGITGQNNIPLKIEIASTDLSTNDVAGFVDYINALNPALTVLETNSLVQYYLTDTQEIYQFVGIGKGTYGLGQTQIAPENVLKLTFSGGGSIDLQQVLENGATYTALGKTLTIYSDVISIFDNGTLSSLEIGMSDAPENDIYIVFSPNAGGQTQLLFPKTETNEEVAYQSYVDTGLSDKVDKVAGKQLSTEDYTTAEKSKLSGISSGATANDTDANLLNRANHTGSQAISTITDLQTELDAKDIKNTELNLLNDYALSSITTAQKLFNVGTSGNGAFSLDANSLYEFEMFVYLDNLSTTSSNFSFQILGTATYSNILLRSEAVKQTFFTGSIFNSIITATTSYQLVTNSTASTGLIKITGSFRTSSAGTFIPSILLSVANAANVKKGSYAKIKKIGADTFTATSGIS